MLTLRPLVNRLAAGAFFIAPGHGPPGDTLPRAMEDDIVSPMLSKRQDGKGHWPKGRPRNTGQKVAGWHSVDAFLAQLWRFVGAHRLKRRLASDLDVEESTIYRWSTGVRQPDQEHLNALVAWYRRNR